MGTSRGENTALIKRFHYNHLFSIIQIKLIQAKILSQKSDQKKIRPPAVQIYFGQTFDVENFCLDYFRLEARYPSGVSPM